MDERTLHRVRGLPGATAGRHDTLLYWKKQDAATVLSADIRVLGALPDAMRTEVEVAASMLPYPMS